MESKIKLVEEYYAAEKSFMEKEFNLKQELVSKYTSAYCEAIKSSEMSLKAIEENIRQIEIDETILSVYEVEKKHGVSVPVLRQKAQGIVEQELHNNRDVINQIRENYTRDRNRIAKELAVIKEGLTTKLQRSNVSVPLSILK